MKFLRHNRGFSLVEMLVYLILLTLIFLTLVNIVLSFTKSYQQLGALRMAEHTGLTAMERMARDIHSAASIDTGNSTFGSSFGTLSIVIGTTTTKYYVVGNQLRVDVGGTYIGPLSVTRGKLTSLVFNNISTANSQAVRIVMTVNGTSGSASKTKTYRTTVTLKNS